MKIKKYLAKGLTLGMLISNLPLYSFANNIENKYYNELSNIETKEDLQKSVQKAVAEGEVGTWVKGLTNMSLATRCLTSAVVDKKIYVIGGYNSSGFSNKTEMYDPVENSWKIKASMPTVRTNSTAVAIGKKIYIIGGYSGAKFVKDIDVYDTESDSWETKTSIPTSRNYHTTSVVDGKIYVIGGSQSLEINSVEMYDPVTDKWETKAPLLERRDKLISSVVNGKIYVFGGHLSASSPSVLNKVEMYDPATDSWETKTNMPTARYNSTSSVVDDKIYIIGGSNDQALNKLEVYDPATDSWETKTNIPTGRTELTSSAIDGKIYCFGGENIYKDDVNKVEVYIAREPSLEEQVTSAILNAESTKEMSDIEETRKLVNQLCEGELKTQLQSRLDAIIPNLSLETLNGTSSVDTYITTENILSMTLDTNTISFEDFSGIEDMVKANAINVTVSSSLPYQLNAYLPVELQNSDKTKTMDKSILNIKENSELEYKVFSDLNTKLVLKDNCIAGDDLHHGIDLKLKQGIAHEKDVYKATIKLEVEQK